MEHMVDLLILRKKQIYNQYFHFYFLNMDISLNISPAHTHFFKVYREQSYLGKHVSDYLFGP